MQVQVKPRLVDWYAVRVKPPHNTGRRTVVLGAEYEQYRSRSGHICKRRIKGTGHREHLPKLLLERAGFEVFLPLRKEWRRVNRVTQEKHLVTFPLLADWVFVGWNPDQPRWADLMALDIVVGALGTNGIPARIPDRRIMQMMRAWGGGKVAPEHQRWMRTHAEFDVGDLVRVAAGSWEGFEMNVVEMSGSVAKGIISLLGRETELEMPADWLERV
ncbi:transcription termination/antitermination protein NusG [Ruegeria arenilitoris]|uniref:transcription termination/antitermination protein NusG n=1 Tax=Ruegeria arenilitoris TaxID=1173585 RepID=UPI00147C836C|nr:transcription termination/antitermination NusG family protein [Ruegeria arenilitoris]